MKKIIALLLVLSTFVLLFGCDKTEDPNKQEENNKPDTEDTQDTQLGASYKVIIDQMARHNCKDGNKYDKSVPESNENWKLRHDGVELGVLELYGCELTDDSYKVVNNEKFAIKYKVEQNLGALVSKAGTKNGAESMWVNRDENVGALDTDITTAIGVGAYYVKILYTDGGEKAFSKTNFFENAEKGMSLDMVTAKDLDAGKTVASIEVTLLYEAYAGAPGFLGVWWHEYTNWRCEYTYKF